MKVNNTVKIIDKDHRYFGKIGVITGFNPTNEYVNVYLKPTTNRLHDNGHNAICKINQVEVVTNESF